MGNKSVKETTSIKPESISSRGPSLHSETKDATSMTSSKASSLPSAMSNQFRLVTWNIYGLDRKELQGRTEIVCDTLKSLSPDAIFLQEVVPQTLPLIQDQLGALYELVPGGQRNAYFTLTLIKKSPHIKVTETTIRAFPKTKLGRNLLIVKAVCNGVKMTLMNTHLESREEDGPERRNQLSQCMAEMKAQGSDTVAIFGGDTNLDHHDDEEIEIPEGILDAWEECGSQAKTMFTFEKPDTSYQVRIDRIFIRSARQDNTSGDDRVRNLKIASFDLIGKERIPGCNDRFPSDHWGVVCEFDIV